VMLSVKEQVRKWLEDGEIDIFIGYREFEGHPIPYFFTRENMEELDSFVESGLRYPLEKLATRLSKLHPEKKIGLLLRDCNQRALNVLYIWNQLNPENIKTIILNCCPSSLKDRADCSYLKRQEVGTYKKEVGIDNNISIEELEKRDADDRWSRWMYEFQKCIKCYGCREICPVCFCKECSLEDPELISPGNIPPEVPIFHLVRAVHMAGRCIDCGLCEEVCPMDIPLRLLYRMINDIVIRLFDYKTGVSMEQSPFNILGEEVKLEPKSL